MSAPQLPQIARRMNALDRVARRAREDRINYLEWLHDCELSDESLTLLCDPVIVAIDEALSWDGWESEH